MSKHIHTRSSLVEIKTRVRQTGADHFERAARIASYYGFLSAGALAQPRRDVPIDTIMREALGHTAASALTGHFAARASEPVMFYHASSTSAGRECLFYLEVIGVPKSIAEAFVIKTALAILHDIGKTDARVYVNSIGDKDSFARFSRELQMYLRKHINDLPPRPRELMKRDIMSAFLFLARHKHALAAAAPKPMEFLSEASRRHLHKVLEYLETIGVPYEVDDDLVSEGGWYSQTLFEIRQAKEHANQEEGTDEAVHTITIAKGGRYDDLLRRSFRVPLSAVRASLMFESNTPIPKQGAALRSARKPKIYFIQLGFDAKLRALMLIETLREARVPLMQSLGAETLTSQLALAEKMGAPYAMIMGQKEVHENTIIVRNLKTRVQETIAVAILPDYLRRVVL